MLDKKTQQMIRQWAVFVKPALDPRIPKDERELKERLEELVWSSLKKGDLDFESTFLSTLYACQAPFPLNQKTLCQKLDQVRLFSETVRLQDVLLPVWEAVMDESPNAWVIYDAVCAFMDHLKVNQIDQHLRAHWKKPYLGSACVRLMETIQKYQQESSRQFYSKTIHLLQSSGAGKSRLAHEYGNIAPMVIFVIREPTRSGFPPSDEPVFNFLRSHPDSLTQEHLKEPPRSREADTETVKDRADQIWVHALAIGILQATFEQCSKKITEWDPANPTSAALASKFQKFLGNVNNPSPRIEFYKKIVASAKDISVSCVADPSFRQIFDDQDESLRKKLDKSQCNSLRQFRAAVNDLQDTVKLWRQVFENENDPLFTLVFDEVGSLMNDTDNGRFIALNRIISILSEDNVWFLFLSTESRLGNEIFSNRARSRTPGPEFNEPSSRSEGPLREPLKRYPHLQALLST